MLSSAQLKLLLTLEEQQLEKVRRQGMVLRSELSVLADQRQQLSTLMAEYRSAQASYAGDILRFRQQVKLANKLQEGVTDLKAVLAARQEQLSELERRFQQHHQHVLGWRRQFDAAVRLERKQLAKKQRRQAERNWLESQRDLLKI